MPLIRKAKDTLKGLWYSGFAAGQRLGVNVTPNHFYSNVPDLRELKAEKSWRRPLSMVGIAGAELGPQWEFARGCCERYRERLARRDIHRAACAANGEAGYGAGEAAFLYAFIRRYRPGRIVQVGCGVSSAVIQMAAQEEGYTPEIVCIEPYPSAFLRDAASAGKIVLIAQKAQDLDPSRLTGLGDGGFLFVDSSHTLRPGSEVTRIVLEVLPRLAPGSWVHFHDVAFPYDFSARMLWNRDLFWWHETVLLQAFLCQNPRYEIAVSLSMLTHADPVALAGLLGDYSPARVRDGLLESEGDFASSVYIRVRA